MELLVVERGAGHGAVAVEDNGGQAFIGGRGAGRHRLNFRNGLKAGPVESAGRGRVVTFGAVLLENGGAARFLGGPLRRRLGGRQRLAPDRPDDGDGAHKESK